MSAETTDAGVSEGGCGAANEHANMAALEHLRRCPICNLRFEGEERRALEDWLIDNRWALEAYDFSHALIASDWLDAVRRKAADDRAERITQAIEAEWFNGNLAEDVRDRLLARIAREVTS